MILINNIDNINNTSNSNDNSNDNINNTSNSNDNDNDNINSNDNDNINIDKEQILNEYLLNPKILKIRASNFHWFLVSKHNKHSVKILDDFVESNWGDSKFVKNDIEMIDIIKLSDLTDHKKELLINEVNNFNVKDIYQLRYFFRKISNITSDKKIQQSFRKFGSCQFGINMEHIILEEFCKLYNKKLITDIKRKDLIIYTTPYFKLNLVGIPDGITTTNEIIEVKSRTNTISKLKDENINQLKSYLVLHDFKEGYLVEGLIKDESVNSIISSIPKNIELRCTKVKNNSDFLNNKNLKINCLLGFTLKIYENYFKELIIDKKIEKLQELYVLFNSYDL